MAQNSNTSSSLVPHSIYAAGTTGLSTAAATVVPSGCIYAAASVRASKIVGTTLTMTGALSGTTVTASTGYTFDGGQVFAFSAGTVITSGAATAAIVSTGLTTIRHVYFNRVWQSRTAGATTRASYSPSPAIAQGTPGSFYPLIGFIAPGAVAAHTLGIGAGATFSYLALGAA